MANKEREGGKVREDGGGRGALHQRENRNYTRERAKSENNNRSLGV